MSDFDLKWAKLATHWTNLGLFQIRFQYILAPCAKNVLKSDLEKSRIGPFRTNLLHSGSKCETSQVEMNCLHQAALCSTIFYKRWRTRGEQLSLELLTLRSSLAQPISGRLVSHMSQEVRHMIGSAPQIRMWRVETLDGAQITQNLHQVGQI